MTAQRERIGATVVNILLFLLFFLLHYTGVFTVRVLNATPLILLPCLVTFSMFREELPAAMTGLLVGVFMDSTASGSYIFNTALMFFIALTVSLTVHYLLNNNIRTAIMLSLLGSLLYFLLRWLVFYAFGGSLAGSLIYLLQYALPSVIYTNLFSVPLYYLQRWLHRPRLK